jgi:hypothetical protein
MDRNQWNEKARVIQAVLEEDPVDLWCLRGLALTEGGLINGTYVHVNLYMHA